MSGKQKKKKKNGDRAQSKDRVKGAERLEIVRLGLEQGKSRRRIADELGYNEKTIRRDIAKLALPPEQLAAIQAGDSAEKYLNAALLRETGIDWSARNKLGRRRRQEEANGKHSDPLARTLLGWLSKKNLPNTSLEHVLNDAKRMSEWAPDSKYGPKSGIFGDVVGRVERDPNPDRRLTSPGPEFLNQCARGLVIGLLRVEPLQVIRQAALNKAVISVQARGHWMHRPEWKRERDITEARRIRRGGN